MSRKLSIIIPCRNEVASIDQALASILSSLEGLPAEVLVCDGSSTDGTAERIRQWASSDPRVRLVENPAKHAPHGMNAGLSVASGDCIFIVSAHAVYSQDYFRQLAEALDRLGAACAGGLLRTEVKVDSPVARAIRAVLGDPFGVGDAHFRTGATEERQVDTVAFGCYPRWVFDQFGRYDERLLRNQDIELNRRILAGGGTIWLIPSAQATYFARPRLGPFLQNQFENGRWNLLTLALTGASSISLRHLVPTVFVLSLLLPGMLALYRPLLGLPALASLAAYLPLATWRAFRLRKEGAHPLCTLGVFLLLHATYGLGGLAGALQVPFLGRRAAP